MSLWGNIAKAFSNKPEPRKSWFNAPSGDVERRWEVTKTTSSNFGHWTETPTMGTINRDLFVRYEILRSRCQYEAANNPMVEGIISTHVQDLVGEKGPGLTISAGDKATKAEKAYCQSLQDVFMKWWRKPDTNGVYSGPSMLKQGISSMWTCGEFLWRIVRKQNSSGDITLRLYQVDPRRLRVDPELMRDPNYILGVQRDDTGKPLNYTFFKYPLDRMWFTWEFDVIPASQVIHYFDPKEPEQARGLPYLTWSLDMCAQARDYRKAVLDAAQNAASMGVTLYTEHPDATYVEVNETVEIKKNCIQTMVPGWKPAMLNSTQPIATYREYMDELDRLVGRPVNMPLQTVKIDSGNASYSASRWNDRAYVRGIDVKRHDLGERVLDPLVDLVEQEAFLLGKLKGKRPENMINYWRWPYTPNIDPLEDSKATEADLVNDISSLEWELERRNRTVSELVASKLRVKEAFDSAGLDVPVPGTNKPPIAKPDGLTPDSQSSGTPNNKPEGKDNA